MNPVGIGQHSYCGDAWKGAGPGKFHDALGFLQYAHSLGAAGVQCVLKPEEFGSAGKIREFAEAKGLYYEGNVTLPKAEADWGAFEEHVKAIVAAGGNVARTACLSGRRYETFKSLEEFRAFKSTSEAALGHAEPILKKHKLKLAVENHKDWLTPELVGILKKLSSEWIGACVDTGNNVALFEGPYEMIEALGPLVFSSHIKDMGTMEYEQGLLLSEVPFGDGFLEVATLAGMLRDVNPKIRLNLEMITRDPLKIPCLTAGYWKTFENPKASRLAWGMASMKKKLSASLPTIAGLTPERRLAYEDENVRKSLKWATENIKG